MPMLTTPTIVRRAPLLIVVSAVLWATVALVTVDAAHAESDSSGIELEVEIEGPDAPTTSPAPSSSPGGGGDDDGDTPGPTITETEVSVDEADEALGDDTFDLSGILTLSGLSGVIEPSPDAAGGDATLRFTVRSSASTPVDFDVAFQLDNALGVTVASVARSDGEPLQPGETRTIDATLPDIGQWTVYNARVTFTPPEEVDGVELAPITRDTTLVAPPYFSILVGAGAAVAALLAVGAAASSGAAPGLGGLASRLAGLIRR